MEDTIDYVIQGWIARDEDGSLWLYREEKPIKHFTGYWSNSKACEQLEDYDFPSVKFEDDEPTEIEIKIKR